MIMPAIDKKCLSSMIERSCFITLTLALGACAGLNPLPGGALTGCERTTDNFAFAKSATLLRLETRGEAPYSVWLKVTSIEDRLFIDAAPKRRWHDALKSNPNIRVGISDKIYPALAVRTQEPRFIKPFLSGRIIYEVLPKNVLSGFSVQCANPSRADSIRTD